MYGIQQLKGYCNNTEFEENKKSSQRIVDALIEAVDKQLQYIYQNNEGTQQNQKQ